MYCSTFCTQRTSLHDHFEMFTLSSHVRNYNTRSSSAGIFYQKNVKKASGAKIWNSIPKNLRKLSKHAFKKQIHINLLLLDLQRQDSYADIVPLLMKLKKNHFNPMFCNFYVFTYLDIYSFVLLLF